MGEALRTSLKPLGVPARVVDEALKEAYEAQNEFRGRLVTAGAEALALLEEHDELGVVLVGRPYNIYDSGVNMDIPAKLRRYYGVNVIPMDFLPLWGTDTARHHAQHVLELRAQDPAGGQDRVRATRTCTSST